MLGSVDPDRRQTRMQNSMADSTASGTATTPDGGPASQVQVRVAGQYIKDLSFENPNVHKLLGTAGEKPALRIEVNVNAIKIADHAYESMIKFKAEAANKSGVIYDLELVYGGVFQIENLPEQALEPFLLINCPSLLFPFVRRLVADLTRDGGFPPLLLDPIDFAALYMQRQQSALRPQGVN
jgi:preprotein translocase subunit SecB